MEHRFAFGFYKVEGTCLTIPRNSAVKVIISVGTDSDTSLQTAESPKMQAAPYILTACPVFILDNGNAHI